MSVQVSKTGNETRVIFRNASGSETLIAYKREIDGKTMLGHRGLRFYDLSLGIKTSRYNLGCGTPKSKRLMTTTDDLQAAFEKAGIPMPAVLPPVSVGNAVRAVLRSLRGAGASPSAVRPR